MHRPSAEDVQMNMVNSLPALRIAVGHYPEPPLRNTLIGRDFIGNLYQMPYEIIVFLFNIKGCRDMLFGDHEGVNGRLRV